MKYLGDTSIIKDSDIAYISVLKTDKNVKVFTLKNGDEIIDANGINEYGRWETLERPESPRCK